MRALRELRDRPPRTAQAGISWERGLHTHPEYDPSASEAASLLYPDRESLMPPRSAAHPDRVHPEHDPERSEAGSLLYPDRPTRTATATAAHTCAPVKREIRGRTPLQLERCEAGALLYPTDRAPSSNAPSKRETQARAPVQMDQGAISGAVATARARRFAQRPEQAPTHPAHAARRQWELPPRAGLNEPSRQRCSRPPQRAEILTVGYMHQLHLPDAPAAAVDPSAMDDAAQQIAALRMQVAGLTQLLQHGVVVPLPSAVSDSNTVPSTLGSASAVRVWFDASPGADLPAWRWAFGNSMQSECAPSSDRRLPTAV